ncbi:MAG: efflux RND transporter periplasmic adaptor subunit [Nitrospirae bacterium]|nr:efflux RND transporter periplasmic adaptor subunit [Nitrospirota bacterium]
MNIGKHKAKYSLLALLKVSKLKLPLSGKSLLASLCQREVSISLLWQRRVRGDFLNINLISSLFAIIIVLGIAVLTTGCGKKETAKEDKHSAVEEKKEAGEHKGEHKGEHEDEHDGEEPGVVTLSPEKQKSSGIEVRQVANEDTAVPLSATAVIEMNMDRSAKISPRVTGKVVRIFASQGDRLRAGQTLAYIDSVELDHIWADYLKAQGKVELAGKNFQREETLFEKKISPEKDVLKARQELGEAEADLDLAKERFRLLGVDVSQFESSKGNRNHPLIPVTTPVGGVVLEKIITQGEMVNSEKVLFTVADLSSLWVVIDIYEKDISRLRPGSGVRVSVTAFPEKTFKGKISYIADVVDEKTRTEKARVTIDNSSGLLKPGMFATVLIEATSGATQRLIAVPEEAVIIDGTKRYVFIQTSPTQFKVREIEAGRTLGNRVELTSGLREGEMVAVKGAFILKSELKKGEIVDEHGHGK